jgi:hypothetical protein
MRDRLQRNVVYEIHEIWPLGSEITTGGIKRKEHTHTHMYTISLTLLKKYGKWWEWLGKVTWMESCKWDRSVTSEWNNHGMENECYFFLEHWYIIRNIRSHCYLQQSQVLCVIEISSNTTCQWSSRNCSRFIYLVLVHELTDSQILFIKSFILTHVEIWMNYVSLTMGTRRWGMTKEVLTLYNIQIYHVIILVYFKELSHDYVGLEVLSVVMKSTVF